MSSGNNNSEKANGSDSNDQQKNSGKSMADSELVSEPKSCPICLNHITNLSKTDVCGHEYCLECISEWSSEHNRCPVCRQRYSNILFNIRADNNFEQIPVDSDEQMRMNEIRIRRNLLNMIAVLTGQQMQRRYESLFSYGHRLMQMPIESSEQTNEEKDLKKAIIDQFEHLLQRHNETLSNYRRRMRNSEISAQLINNANRLYRLRIMRQNSEPVTETRRTQRRRRTTRRRQHTNTRSRVRRNNG